MVVVGDTAPGGLGRALRATLIVSLLVTLSPIVLMAASTTRSVAVQVHVTVDQALLAFGSGLLAAVSPCVVVLVPVVMVRFSGRSRSLPGLAAFSLGFHAAYLVFGLLVSSLLTSYVQGGFRLGLAVLFVGTAALTYADRLNPLAVPLLRSPLVLGAGFALLMSFNPCTVPFLAIAIALQTRTDAVLALVIFAQGLLTPAIVFALVGRTFLRFIKRGGRAMHVVNKASNVLLALSGGYMATTVTYLHATDAVVAVAFALFAVGLSLTQTEIVIYHEHATTPRWNAAVGPRFRVVLGTLLVALGALSTAALVGAHDEETHALLDEAMGATAAADDEDSAVCIDLSLIPPCNVCRLVIFGLVAFILVWSSVVHAFDLLYLRTPAVIQAETELVDRAVDEAGGAHAKTTV